MTKNSRGFAAIKLRGISLHLFIVLISTSFYAIIGVILIGLSLSHEYDVGALTGNLIQIVNDWQTVPFVSLQLTRDDTCPSGTEEAIYKLWQGTQTMCLCHRSYMNEHRLGACSSTKSRLNLDFDSSYCAELAALSPVVQGSFGGYRVCGTRGGLSYIE